jgi:hypothetical protein
MLIIGNKPYTKIDLNEIVDSYGKNIRLNLGLPGKNNGTLKYIHYANVHVYDNIKYRNIKTYINSKGVSENYVNEFDITFNPNDYICILKQNNSNRELYNIYLNSISCPYTFKKIPRLGCNAIFDILLELNNTKNYMGKNEKLYITHFSLYSEENKKHQYVSNDIISDCHCSKSEALILRWLHNNNYIDATLSAIQDADLPLIDCAYIKPSNDVTDKFLKKYGICILKNFYNNEQIDILNNEFNIVFENSKDKIEILDKEDCSNDERIFHAEKYSIKIKEIFSDNVFLNNCAVRFKKNLNKKTLINRIVYEKNKIKNSGAGWHRDNHDCQFKALMYLTDVTDQNGNFQFLTNSSKNHIGYPKPRTTNYNTRYADETINHLIQTNDNINLFNIIGKKGTVILANTTYIHRGNIIEQGERKAITQYYF